MSTRKFIGHYRVWEPLILPGGLIGIPLTQGKTGIIDAADYEAVRGYSWFALKKRDRYYVRAKGGRLKLHRLLLGAQPGQQVDHVNRDGLDNRRANLRLCSGRENRWNTQPVPNKTGYVGVYRRSRNSYAARLVMDGVRKDISRHPTAFDAALAYDRAALAQRGSFAVLNFPDLVGPNAPVPRVNVPAPITLTHDGRTLTLSEWSVVTGFPWYLLRDRVARGWAVKDILTLPVSTKPYRLRAT